MLADETGRPPLRETAWNEREGGQRERVRERVRGRKKEADILYYEELLVTGS